MSTMGTAMNAALDASLVVATAGTPAVAAAAPTIAPATQPAAAMSSAPAAALPLPAATVATPTAAPAPASAPASADAAPAVAPVASPTPLSSASASAATSAAATAATQKRATGITFPVRPAATGSTQAPSNAVGHASAADAGSVGGALFSLVVVVGLILALGWLAKRMPGLQRGGGSAQLKVVASVALGPRDRAVVVDVGGTQLLLGVGQGGVRTLHTLERPLPVAEASNSPSPFAQILAQHFGRKP